MSFLETKLTRQDIDYSTRKDKNSPAEKALNDLIKEAEQQGAKGSRNNLYIEFGPFLNLQRFDTLNPKMLITAYNLLRDIRLEGGRSILTLDEKDFSVELGDVLDDFQGIGKSENYESGLDKLYYRLVTTKHSRKAEEDETDDERALKRKKAIDPIKRKALLFDFVSYCFIVYETRKMGTD